LTMDFLAPEEIKGIIKSFISVSGMSPLQEDFLDELTMTFKGLSETEINNILALAVADDGEINHQDLSLIFEQKQQMIKKSGILDMVTVNESIDDIGGLENLKKWLQRKAEVFKNITKARSFGVDVPKGVLIAGMPGCGKSLNAKAAAKLFGVPLLRMDMGRLMGKYVGESEGNMRRAIALAEASSPCVLWIDELEKAFAGIGGQGGGAEVTTRLFGNFLTWLQEKDSLAFVVATANNIADLPPELLRKGRFDEIFYVGLPNKEEREKIFSIHIGKRRKQDLSSIDLSTLVSKTEGYSGADIEGVVRDSVEDAFASRKTSLVTDDIVRAINNTHSLSEIMKDSLDKMSKIYKERKFKNASA
ncbi:MAG: AAA family ATPase, partial [Schwartzia sp.]|nr:AAA family ATPase [Schwartzia sp. (in: firmicutes)]